MSKSFSIKKNNKLFIMPEEPIPVIVEIVEEEVDKKGKKSKKSKKSKKEVSMPVPPPPPAPAHRKLGGSSSSMRIKRNFRSTVVDSY
jgi:hypothetical protein